MTGPYKKNGKEKSKVIFKYTELLENEKTPESL